MSAGRANATMLRKGTTPAASVTIRAPRRYLVSPGTCSTTPSRTSDPSRRATVLFGSSTRSATSVTPTGPSVSAPSTAKARSIDWTLDIGLPLG